jgi:flagellar biosynthesis protein FlhB
VNQLERVTSIRFGLGRPTKFSSINIIRLIARTIRIIIDIVNIVASVLKIIFIFFTSAFLCRSLLLKLRKSNESMIIQLLSKVRTQTIKSQISHVLLANRQIKTSVFSVSKSSKVVIN